MKKQIQKAKSFGTAVLDDNLSLTQIVFIALFIIAFVCACMYSYDPTSFNAYKHF